MERNGENMPDVIVFERFADFLIKNQRYKKNYVHNVMQKGAYKPEQDYYLKLRQKLISLFKKNASLNELDNILKKITPKKFNNYEILIEQIQNFMQGKKYTWIMPPRNTIDYAGLVLTVNPEISLNIDGEIFLIKMYFKKKELSNSKAKIMQKIMQDALQNGTSNVKVAIWDIRRGMLYDVSINKKIKVPYNLEQEALNWQKYAEVD